MGFFCDLASVDKRRYAHGMKISVKVKTNAKENAVEAVDSTHYSVRITAAPAQGKANDMLIKLLAAHFDIPRSRIKIVSGFSSHAKMIEIL